jgi:hypothetical protein
LLEAIEEAHAAIREAQVKLAETAPNGRDYYPQGPAAHGEAVKPVVLNRAGDKSKYTGQIMVTDGQPFGMNKYFGRIDQSGVFHATDSATVAVSELLRRLGENPAEVASEYGRLTGNCCFCSRKLDDARSTAVGYGPVCAEKFGLEWGA